jgi:hypothetical protein
MSGAGLKIEKYSFDMKKKIKERIDKINTSREHIEKIKQIIFKYNPNLPHDKNSSGVLLFFHALEDITYQKIDIYLKKIEFEKIKQLTTTNISDEDLIAPTLSENFNNNIRLSSLEKNIIKKKDYYEKLKEENNVDTDIIYKSDDDDMDIFLNKDTSLDISNKRTNKKPVINKTITNTSTTTTKSKINKAKNK